VAALLEILYHFESQSTVDLEYPEYDPENTEYLINRSVVHSLPITQISEIIQLIHYPVSQTDKQQSKKHQPPPVSEAIN